MLRSLAAFSVSYSLSHWLRLWIVGLALYLRDTSYMDRTFIDRNIGRGYSRFDYIL
jgi:hypothetical protein